MLQEEKQVSQEINDDYYYENIKFKLDREVKFNKKKKYKNKYCTEIKKRKDSKWN